LPKRTFAILLSGILIATVLNVHSTRAQTGQSSQTAEAARAGVERLGVGKNARTEITLRDKRKLKGYISAAGADSFTLADQKTGASQTIAYADVDSVKKPHHGLKTRSWIIIAGVAAAVVIVGIIVKPAFCDGC
jgi:hypothetical protein